MLLVMVLLLIVFQKFFRDYWEARLENEGITLDCDMSAKFRELLDDCTMTDAKWREWLPVFEFADKEVRKKAPRLPLGNHSRLIRRELSNEDEAGSL